MRRGHVRMRPLSGPSSIEIACGNHAGSTSFLFRRPLWRNRRRMKDWWYRNILLVEGDQFRIDPDLQGFGCRQNPGRVVANQIGAPLDPCKAALAPAGAP